MTLNNPFKNEIWIIIVLAFITTFGYWAMISDELSGWWLVIPAIPLVAYLVLKSLYK